MVSPLLQLFVIRYRNQIEEIPILLLIPEAVFLNPKLFLQAR